MGRKSREKLDFRFSITPDWLLDRNPSGTALKVWLDLARRGTLTEDGDWYTRINPSHQTIADRTALSLNTIKRAIRELEQIDALVITHRFTEHGDKDSNEYRLRVGPPMAGGQATDGPTTKGTNANVSDLGQATDGLRVGPPVGYNPDPFTQSSDRSGLRPQRSGAAPSARAEPTCKTQGCKIKQSAVVFEINGGYCNRCRARRENEEKTVEQVLDTDGSDGQGHGTDREVVDDPADQSTTSLSVSDLDDQKPPPYDWSKDRLWNLYLDAS